MILSGDVTVPDEPLANLMQLKQVCQFECANNLHRWMHVERVVNNQLLSNKVTGVKL